MRDPDRRCIGVACVTHTHTFCSCFVPAGSGYITYDEFRRVSLVKLSLEMSESEVRALWCALDADDSNQLQKNEMGAFLRLAPTDTNAGLDAINAKRYRQTQADKRAAEEAEVKARSEVLSDDPNSVHVGLCAPSETYDMCSEFNSHSHSSSGFAFPYRCRQARCTQHFRPRALHYPMMRSSAGSQR